MGIRNPEFSRRTWTTAAARRAWEPRMAHAAAAWSDLEFRSVAEGLRPAGLVFGRTVVEEWGFDYAEVAPDRFAIGPAAADLAAAYRAGDDDAVGALLGFPDCCRRFFAETWSRGSGDTTFEMTRGGDASGPIEANILGRWLGLRFVMHLPCAFTCAATARLGVTYRALLRDLDPAGEGTIAEVLAWPIEWSALHGAAEIRYPVVKVITRTGYSATKRVVRRAGVSYPAEGARGLTFPYTEAGMPTASDNGFPTVAAQDAGHAMILAALRTSPPRGAVLDLGAGNGLLMQRVAATFLRPVRGVEVDAAKAAKHPNIVRGDLRALDTLALDPVDTVIVSVRRFEEIPTLEPVIRRLARQGVIYSYDDPTFARVDRFQEE